MKTIIIFFLSVILFVSIAIGWEVRNIRKNKDQSFDVYGISIGDTTLQAITQLKIQGKNHKCLRVKRIKKGKNFYYLELNDRTGLYLIIMKP